MPLFCVFHCVIEQSLLRHLYTIKTFYTKKPVMFWKMKLLKLSGFVENIKTELIKTRYIPQTFPTQDKKGNIKSRL
jgi:hypothetical protein